MLDREARRQRTGGDEESTHEERAKDAPLEHATLIPLRDIKMLKDDVKDEDVVDGEAFFE